MSETEGTYAFEDAAEGQPLEEPEAEEPGVAGDPDHGLPGEAEDMPEGDAEIEPGADMVGD